MRSVKTRLLFSLIVCQILLPAPIFADPFPPLDQKRSPLVLKAHGIFWAGGQIVNRTQSGTENSGDMKNLSYNQQQYSAFRSNSAGRHLGQRPHHDVEQQQRSDRRSGAQVD